MVAFSNADGGRLLLGIRDNGSIAGVKSDEEYYMAEAAAKLYSKPAINFQTKQWIIEGKSVLEITIPKDTESRRYAQNDEGKWLVYIRKDDQNIVAPGILLKIWEQQKNPTGVFISFTEEEKRLLTILESEQPLSLNQFVRKVKLPRWKGEKILVKLIVIGVIGIEVAESGTRFFIRDDFEDKNSDHTKLHSP